MSEDNSGNHKNNGPSASSGQIAEVIRAALHRRVDSEFTPAQAMAASENYRNGMNHYRRRGREFLAEGDYRQAAEKSWGAFAQSVKAIAADYSMRISFHGSIIRVAGHLASLAAQDDPDAGAVLSDGLGQARSLHQHFYENDLPPEQVIFSTQRVGAAIDLMQQRFTPGANGGN